MTGTEISTPRRGARRRPLRRDIEGLRAVAILSVVLYHAHVGALSGGYVGVDVFFVISGYLITDLLWREVSGSGRLSFANFYGRRIRRLLPMSLLVLSATAVVSALVLPPLTARSALHDGLACAFYVGNYHFALAQTNYLDVGAAASPFQQYWSLGVEEQFYLLWPALLVAASLVWRRGAASRTAVAAALAVVAASSFALSLWLTHASEPWAFFSLPTRAWELALGGLVALGAPTLARWRARPLLGWAGFGLVLWSVCAYQSTTPFPGVAALAPVLGAAMVIAAGTGMARHGPVDLLRLRPFQVIGRVSYSWYLWHWPVLVLAPAIAGHSLSVADDVGLAALSLLVSMVSFALVERPLRASPWLSALARRSFGLGTVLTGSGVAACVASVLLLPTLSGQGTAPIANAAVARADTATSTPSSPFEALQAQEYEGTAAIQAQILRSLPVNDVPANLTPSIADAAADEPPISVDGCQDGYTDVSLQPCVFGDTTSSTTVVLFGDSHAGMWFPAVDNIANELGWKLIVWTKATCPPTSIPVFSPVLDRTFTECATWRDEVLAQIAALHPALVILGVARHYEPVYGFTVYSPQWDDDMAQTVRQIRSTGSSVVVIGPVPKPPFDVPTCLSLHLTTAGDCTVALSQAIDLAGAAGERAAVQDAGGEWVSTQPWFCTSTVCAVIVDNLLAFRDDNHISAEYANFLTPVLKPELEEALLAPPPAVTLPRGVSR